MGSGSSSVGIAEHSSFGWIDYLKVRYASSLPQRMGVMALLLSMVLNGAIGHGGMEGIVDVVLLAISGSPTGS